ncbi:MAG: hypothetical protein ABIG55_03825 [Candidatus Omnitrophota bacterium]|nr:type II toxin-antitoxin system PrlF family antitoxin [Candidatus Omnitrophota bacterium]
MRGKFRLKFLATVSNRGQIFIPKVLQGYFGIRKRDKVTFVLQNDGNVVFRKTTEGEKNG